MQNGAYRITYKNEKKYWWYTGRSYILKRCFKRFVPINYDSLILNLGGGTGYNSLTLSKYGNVVTLDKYSAPLSFCKSNKLTNLVQGDAQLLGLKDESFDIVVAFDLLEHLKDDLICLQEIKRVLKPSGYALFTVPAFNFMWSNMDVIGKHYRRYTKKELTSKFKGIGLIYLKFSYFNTLLFPFALLRKFYYKIITQKISEDNFLPQISRVMNFILTIIFSSEAHLLTLFNLPFGLSLLTICKKK